MTFKDIKWNREHSLFKGTTFGVLKIGRRKYTVGKGSLFGGGFAIGGIFNGKYNERDVETKEELEEIISDLCRR